MTSQEASCPPAYVSLCPAALTAASRGTKGSDSLYDAVSCIPYATLTSITRAVAVRASTLNTCRDTQEKKDVVKHELWSGDFPVSSDGDITARQRVFKVCFNEPDPADNLRILEMVSLFCF